MPLRKTDNQTTRWRHCATGACKFLSVRYVHLIWIVIKWMEGFWWNPLHKVLLRCDIWRAISAVNPITMLSPSTPYTRQWYGCSYNGYPSTLTSNYVSTGAPQSASPDARHRGSYCERCSSPGPACCETLNFCTLVRHQYAASVFCSFRQVWRGAPVVFTPM